MPQRLGRNASSIELAGGIRLGKQAHAEAACRTPNRPADWQLATDNWPLVSKEFTLLKLKRLQILGFKSFCDRTELKFHGDGVAAIIGPNGCGKSNISDAISWVLGEQSAKTLRGSRMEDVIFAGTRDRKPTGMAEVSLTLIDPEAVRRCRRERADRDRNSGRHARGRPKRTIAEDWDEASIRARAAADTERAVEDAQPGKTEEVEVPRSKINTIAVAFPEDEPIFALPVHNVTAPAAGGIGRNRGRRTSF